MRGLALAAVTLAWSVAAGGQAPHTLPSPLLAMQGYTKQSDDGAQLERERPAGWRLAEHRRLDAALKAVGPHRKGVVDAYVLAVALDSDGVFGREAREAGRVLAQRYDAAGRTVVLAAPVGPGAATLPRGSPDNIAAALARIAEQMDKAEDVLVLYTTSHGAPFGIAYNDGDQGFATLSPYWLWNTLGDLGIRNRLLIVSACFSGVFVPLLSAPDTAILTAASSERTSFGCTAENDWTFFGDALINHALRKPQPLAQAFAEARTMVGGWEAQGRMTPSDPQVSIGGATSRWLGPLEARMPRVATAPVGRPATVALPEASARNH